MIRIARLLLLLVLMLELSSCGPEDEPFARVGELCEARDDCFAGTCSLGPCPEDSNVPGQDNECWICQ